MTEPLECQKADARRHVRQAIAPWPVECEDREGYSWSALVVSHGNGGLGLTKCPPLDVGVQIVVRLEGIGTFPCRVAWSRAGRCGLEFLPEPALLSADAAHALADTIASIAKPPLEPRGESEDADAVTRSGGWRRRILGMIA